MKILIHSNVPWTATGYGQQTALLAPRLKAAGHDVAISATWGLLGGCLHWNDFVVYPSDNAWGNRMLRSWAAQHAEGDPRECLVMPIMDIWTLKEETLAELVVAPWCPVDHDPVPPAVAQRLLIESVTPIAMSRFGEQQMLDLGLDPFYVPHGIDTKVFSPVADRMGLRDHLGIPRDAFVVGMVANNKGTHPPRKAFPQVLQAFAELRERHRDAFLYLHTDMFGTDEGMNLVQHLERLSVPRSAVAFPSQMHLHMGAITPEQLAQAYNAMDVLANPSYGEGFGIPIVEAQACGTPVVVTEWTSMPELCGSGWRVGGEPWYDCGQGSFWRSPSVAQLLEALEDAYESAAGMRDRAREFAVGYDVDRVFEKRWLPTLEGLELTLGAVREVPALA